MAVREGRAVADRTGDPSRASCRVWAPGRSHVIMHKERHDAHLVEANYVGRSYLPAATWARRWASTSSPWRQRPHPHTGLLRLQMMEVLHPLSGQVPRRSSFEGKAGPVRASGGRCLSHGNGAEVDRRAHVAAGGNDNDCLTQRPDDVLEERRQPNRRHVCTPPHVVSWESV